MKNFLRQAVLIGAMVPGLAMAKIVLTDTNQTSFDIGGEIAPECKVSNLSQEQSTALDLSSNQSQNAGNVSIWCNTGQNAADTTYSSANDGFLVNDNGNQIAYRVNVDGVTSELNLTTPQTVSQGAGIGVDGNDQASVVSIAPQISGLETAGSYTDTISVTVSYN